MLTLGWFLHALPAHAVEFGEGEFHGSLDTTISHGVIIRVEDIDDHLVGDVNGNDGDLNYDRGLVSNTSKFTSDLDLGFGNFGAFARVTGFIDFENENGERDRTPLSDAAQARVGQDLEVLDLYVTGAFDVGDTVADLRLGKHVLNWGESTFISNSINAINPLDVSKLRLPGSELREGLVPISMVSASVGPTDTLSMEGFYQLDWEEIEIDPVGTYFSTTDYGGPGAERVVLPIPGTEFLGDTGLTPDNNPFAPFGVADDPQFLNVERGPDREPDDSGQWGIALRYLAEELNDTEFGVYYMNYHSRLPLISAHTGTQEDALTGLKRAGQIGAAAPTVVPAMVAGALAQAGCPSPSASPECGAVANAAQTQGGALAGAAAQTAGIDAYADNAYYFMEYPEDLQLLGLSFNTQLGASGWALQGEYSFRPDTLLQMAERPVLEAGLAPFLGCTDPESPLNQVYGGDAAACIADGAQGTVGFDTDVQGYVESDVSQIQATATKVFGPVLGADGLALVTEVALMHVHDMPEDTRLESPAGGAASDPKDESGEVPHPADADATSWGYRLAARLDYNNAIGAVNLYPYAQLQHDVNGNSPTPIGPFVEGRTALTIGLRADYLSRWQAAIGYTRYAGDRNELSDRDFVYASVKYSF